MILQIKPIQEGRTVRVEADAVPKVGEYLLMIPPDQDDDGEVARYRVEVVSWVVNRRALDGARVEARLVVRQFAEVRRSSAGAAPGAPQQAPGAPRARRARRRPAPDR